MKKICQIGLTLFTLLNLTLVEAGSIVQCGQALCSQNFTVGSNGVQLGGGQLIYDSTTGDISLDTSNITGTGFAWNGGIRWNQGNGDWVSVNSLSGNADPILGFSLSAATGSAGSTFSFSFDLPIAISGPIATSSSVGYSLTSTSGSGAQISGIGGNNVVQAWDVDTSVGGIGSLNKNVDVGDTYFHNGGPLTSNSPIYTAADSITGDLAYDLMSVQVAFALSANSTVGLSGFVQQTEIQQTPVPLPAAGWLMMSGFSLLGWSSVAKRSSRAEI